MKSKKRTEKLFLQSLLIFLVEMVRAQGVDMRGVVSDSVSSERLPYVNVSIVGTQLGAATNLNGFYLITSVPSGECDLAASVVGYERQVKHIIVGDKGPLVVNFRMVQQPVELNEIVVSGRALRQLQEVHTSTHILEKQDLKMVPVAAQEDVLRSIQILPGFVSTSDVNSQFYVRGGAGDQNLILLDGMKIYNPFHAFGLFSIFDPDIVKSAEVYTGAFPADYGNRLSSVINIATRDGGSAGLAGHANMNFLSSKVQLEGPLAENVQWIATGRKSLFSGTFKNFLKQDVPLSFYDALAKVTYKSPDAEYRYSGGAFISHDDMKSADPNQPDYSWNDQAYVVQVNRLIKDRLFVDMLASYSEFSQLRDVKAANVPQTSTSVNELTIRANATSYLESKDLFFFGFEFTVPTLDYKFVDRLGVDRELKTSNIEFGAWLRYQFNLGDFHADAGVRTEIGYLTYGFNPRDALQPRLSLSLDLGDTWRLKTSYGRFGQDIITVNNEDDVLPIFNAWISIPTTMQVEQSDHYVAGLEGNLFPALSVSVQGYDKEYNSLIVYNRDKLQPSDPDYINGTGKSYGAEVLLRFSDPLLDLYSAYTLSWVTVNTGGFEYSPRYDRRHSVNLLSTVHVLTGLDLACRWEFGSGLPFTQSLGFYDKLMLDNLDRDPSLNETGQPYTLLGPKNAARLPAYHRLDISLNYQLQLFSSVRSTVGINVINAYDRKNVFYYDRSTGQRVNMLGVFPTANVTLEFLP